MQEESEIRKPKELEQKTPPAVIAPCIPPILIAAPRAITPEQHQEMQRIEKLYSDLFDFDLSHAFRGLPITLTAAHIAALPEIKTPQENSRPDDSYAYVRPLFEADLQDHTVARGVNAQGEPFIAFKHNPEKEGVEIVTLLFFKYKYFSSPSWLTCKRKANNVEEFFDWPRSDHTYTKSSDIANLMYILGLSKEAPRPSKYISEYESVFNFPMSNGEPGRMLCKQFDALPEIGVPSGKKNPMPGHKVQVFTQEALKGRMGIRGVNETEQLFIMFQLENRGKQELITFVCCPRRRMRSHTTETIWMSYRRAADEKNEFCLFSAMKPVSIEDIEDLIRVCSEIKDKERYRKRAPLK